MRVGSEARNIKEGSVCEDWLYLFQLYQRLCGVYTSATPSNATKLLHCRPFDTLHNLYNLPRLDLIHPSRNRNTIRDCLALLQKLHIILHSLVKIRKRLKVQASQLLLPTSAEILLHNRMCVFVLEREHATAGMLYEEDLVRAEQLLGDD